MHYDPIKNIFAKSIKSNKILRRIFYAFLNLIFLRSWYIRKLLKKLIQELNTEPIYVYDAGTGFAQYSYFIGKKFPQTKILSVDIKEDYLNDAREFFQKSGLNNVEFKTEDLTRISHQNNFHLILCVDVMEHIEDDISVLKNFYNALKENGYVLINTPSIYGGSDVHDKSDESFIGEHFRSGYSKEDMFEKLKQAGFNSFDGFYTYGIWGDKAWRIGIKYPMKLLGISRIFFLVLPFYYILILPFFVLMNFIDTKSRIEKGTGLIVIAKK